MNLLAYLRLMRPPNLLTAVADVLAGLAVVGIFRTESYLVDLQWCWLLLATVCLYGGGVVLNDVLDYDIDKVERPERPIPSGKASRLGAGIFAGLLLLGGVLAAFAARASCGWWAVNLAILIVVYDSIAKTSPVVAPLVMGMCRAFNLTLGIVYALGYSPLLLLLGILPLTHIGAITVISRGEVYGGTRQMLGIAMGLYYLLTAEVFVLFWLFPFDVLRAVPFWVLFVMFTMPPLMQARRAPTGANIFRAVKGGVIAVIILDATLAAGFAGIVPALAILALLPASLGLARLFAVS